jgi:hypothetical protein
MNWILAARSALQMVSFVILSCCYCSQTRNFILPEPVIKEKGHQNSVLEVGAFLCSGPLYIVS